MYGVADASHFPIIILGVRTLRT